MKAAVAYQETGSESLTGEQLLAFLSDAETRTLVQSVIGERWPNAIVHEGGLAAALGTLSQDPSPPILIVDIAGSEDPNAGVRSLLALCDPATRVIAIGIVNDISYYRRLLALGVSDYVVKPFDGAALTLAIDGAPRLRPAVQAVEAEKGRKVISVVGARGGVGATTVAVNLAWIAAHELHRNCAIVDLDLQFGTVGLQLDLEPSHGLREALENPERIDSLFVASAMASESENLFVLSAEEPLEDRIRITSAACDALLEAMPDELETIFLDIPVRNAIGNPELLAASDRIVLVSDPSLVGIRDVARLAALCRNAAPDAGLYTVLNRTGMAKKGEIPQAEFARGVELPLRHFIPFDAVLAATAASSGKPFPLVAARSPAVKALRGLSGDVTGASVASGGRDLLARLFSSKRRAA